MRAFFEHAQEDLRLAVGFLFQAGDAAAVNAAAKRATVGKLLPDDLYVHQIALELLEPLFTVYEGCGRAYLGEVDRANVIKIHRRSGKLSYLAYPRVRPGPAPRPSCAPSRSTLRTRQIDSTDYAASTNPPVLHRKESFMNTVIRCTRSSRGSAREEKCGLLDDTSTMGAARLGPSARRTRLRGQGASRRRANAGG